MAAGERGKGGKGGKGSRGEGGRGAMFLRWTFWWFGAKAARDFAKSVQHSFEGPIMALDNAQSGVSSGHCCWTAPSLTPCQMFDSLRVPQLLGTVSKHGPRTTMDSLVRPWQG